MAASRSLLACCLALALALAGQANAQVSLSGLYARPPEQPPLPESHPLLARSPAANAHMPEQLHLAFAGPGAYAVTWMTYPLDDPRLRAPADAASTGAAQAAAAPVARKLAAAAARQPHVEGGGDLQRRRRDPCAAVIASAGRSVVQYGTAPGAYDYTVESPDPAACYYSGSYVSGAIHRVVFGAGGEGPLPHSTAVYYRVGDPARGWSEEYSFTTAPLAGSPEALPYRLGVIGDLGQTEQSISTLAHLNVSAPASIILTGDLSYADGYQPRWDTWQRLVAPHTRTQVWMYCVGNHEIELTDGHEDFLSYETRFYFPYRQCLSESKLYYSYDVAGVHVIMLGSYAPYGRTSAQYGWLVRDLAAVDRARTPWVVAVQHAPWYNSNYAHQGEGEAMREAMEALLYEHGVDFVFSGHVHAYERHHRVFDGRLDHCAPIHINIGDGGNKEGPDKKWYTQPPFSAYREPAMGHATLDLVDATRAEWRWYRNQDDAPEAVDSVTVVRDPDCKQLRTQRLAAWRARRGAAQRAQRQAQRASEAAVEEEAEAQALLLEQEAGRRAATAAQRAQINAEEAAEQQQQQRRGCWWRRLGRWAQRAARQLGWLH